MESLLLSVAEAAHELKVSRSYLYGMLRKKQLDSIKLGRSRRILRKSITELVTQLQQAEV